MRLPAASTWCIDPVTVRAAPQKVTFIGLTTTIRWPARVSWKTAMRTFGVFLVLLLAAGCSTPAPETKQVKQAPPFGPGPATATNKHPLAKYIELSGFRVSESGAG